MRWIDDGDLIPLYSDIEKKSQVFLILLDLPKMNPRYG